MNTIKVGIAGAAGYTGGELIRILLRHPNVEIAFAHSNSSAGKKWYEVHHDLLGITDRGFTAGFSQDIDVLFLCVGHGAARKFLEDTPLNPSIKVIDLSTDFRHLASNSFGERKFVYGLPELNREPITQANNIANPGCFASAIQLALLPLVAAGKLTSEVHIQATTGSTGAGQKPTASSHFSWRNNNLSVYKALDHQHMQEISESLASRQSALPAIYFIPQRGNFTRGIIAVAQMQSDLTQDAAQALFSEYYESHPFTHVAPFDVDLKQVVNTNFCYVQVLKQGNQLLLISILDNLLKGASGQAVQNMNLMFGLEENSGLQLKASAF